MDDFPLQTIQLLGYHRQDAESFVLVEPQLARLLSVHLALRGQLNAVTVPPLQRVSIAMC